MNKQRWLDAAELFDTWRVVPRVTLFLYGTWTASVITRILSWYFTLPAAERTLEASGVVGVVITAVTGFSPWIFKIYSDNGRNWDQTPKTSETLVKTKTITGADP